MHILVVRVLISRFPLGDPGFSGDWRGRAWNFTVGKKCLVVLYVELQDTQFGLFASSRSDECNPFFVAHWDIPIIEYVLDHIESVGHNGGLYRGPEVCITFVRSVTV